MTASTAHTSADHSDSAYEQACRLIETELGGRRIIADPAEPGHPWAVGAHRPHLVNGDNTVEA